MNVFVTGGNGFLGTALCQRLEREGHLVVRPGSRQCDLTRPDALHRFDGTRYDVLVHLAAWTQAGDFCLRHPGEQWVINQQINTNVLAWWQARQPQARLVAMGTSCAYAPDAELAEENYLEGRPIESLFTYAMTKRMLLVGMESLAKQFGLRYLCLVPSTLYGPGYHTDGRQMHFIFDLVRKILVAKRGGPAPVLWGDGHQKRELVYIDDFVDAVLRLLPAAENTLVNIGAGEEHSIREFAAAICELTGYDFSRIAFDTSRYVGAKSKVLSVKKLRTLLPDYNPRPLRDGLAATIRWFEANWDAIEQAHARAA
jgi:GDP-L-fucose synthase